MIRRPAFTLVEVLLSLVILVILASSLGWAVREMREKTMVLRRASDDLTVCTTLFELLDGAITNSVALDPGSGRAGFRGTADSIDIVSRGVLADLDADPAALAGLIRLRIEFDPQALALRVGRSGASASTQMQPVSRRVERWRFRYHDGQQWTDSFDSRAQGGLPVAVEVSVWFATALNERATLPESNLRSGFASDAGVDDAFEFDGMGAPTRSDVEAVNPMPERRPDRFRIFSVLDAFPEEELDDFGPALDPDDPAIGGRP